MTKVYISLEKTDLQEWCDIYLLTYFWLFPRNFQRAMTYVIVTRCLGDLVTKPDKLITTKPASKPTKVRNQTYLTKMTLTRFIMKTFSLYFKEEKNPRLKNFNWSSWTMRGKKSRDCSLLFERIIIVFTNFNSSLPIKSIHLRPPLILMPSVFQQHRHLRNRLYGIKMDYIQWSGLGPVEIQWHIPSPQQ